MKGIKIMDNCPNCGETWDLESAKAQASYYHCLNCGRIESEEGEIIESGNSYQQFMQEEV